MEIDTATRRMLLTRPAVTGYVGTKVFKNEMLENLTGSGGRAVVVRRNGGLDDVMTVNTDEFPRLVVDCYADPDRSLEGEITVNNGIDKAYALARAVLGEMNRVRDEWWGAGGTDPGVRVLSCGKIGDPIAETSKDQHGGTALGDMAVVTIEFELHIA